MKGLMGIAMLIAWLGACAYSQEAPETDFFMEEPATLKVKIFTLPLGDGDWTMNCYLAWDSESKKALVIDPGAPAPALAEFIRSKGLDVLAILNTHGHYDHVGGVASLSEAFPVPVYLHRADHSLAARTTGSAVIFTDYPANGRLILGNIDIEVIHTPGHSPGSVCLKSGEILFSGDTLFAAAIGKAHGNSPRQREANLRLEVDNIREYLLSLPLLTKVYPGHGRSTTIGAEKAFNPFLK